MRTAKLNIASALKVLPDVVAKFFWDVEISREIKERKVSINKVSDTLETVMVETKIMYNIAKDSRTGVQQRQAHVQAELGRTITKPGVEPTALRLRPAVKAKAHEFTRA